MHVLVAFSDDMSEVPLDDLIMCIHYEPSRLDHVDATSDHMSEVDTSMAGRHKFRVGEIVFLPENVLSADVGDAVWSRATRVSDAKLQQLSKSTQRKTVLFPVNRNKILGTVWRSDDSNARTQNGHFVTTIFLFPSSTRQSFCLDSSMQSKERVLAVVLWRQQVVFQEFGDASSLELDSTPTHNTGYANSTVSGMTPANFAAPEEKRRYSRFESVHYPSEEHNIDNYDDYATNTSDVADTDYDFQDISDDTELWQHTSFARHIDFRGKSQRLFILWKFFTDIQLNDIDFTVDCIEEDLRSHLQQAAAIFRVPSDRSSEQLADMVTSFLSDIFGNVFVAPSRAGLQDNIGANLSSSRSVSTIQVTVHLFLRALSSRSADEILRSALRAGKDAASKMQLQDLFVSLVTDLYDTIDAIFCEVISDNDASLLLGDQTASLAMLIDDVMSLVYNQKRFTTLQPEILAVLRWQHTPNMLTKALNDAFQMFAAQVRETMIASAIPHTTNTQQPRIHNGPRIGSGSLLQNGCNYRWLLEPTSVQVHDIVDRDILSNIKLASIAQLVREFSCIDLEIEKNAASLSLRSVFSLPHNSSLMKLVLDSRHRVFRVLPSGLSSMIRSVEGWLIGDYVGSSSGDGMSVDVDFFAYKDDGETPFDTRQNMNSTSGFTTDSRAVVARRLSLSITLEEKQGNICHSPNLDGDCLPSNLVAFVDGLVSDSTYRHGLAENDILSEMTSAERGELWDTLEWIPLTEIRAGYVALRGTH